MSDLTILFTTYNKVPKEWAKYHREVLQEAIGDSPVISITKKPCDWGTNILQEEYGVVNLYRQLLKGAKLAQTPYIAIAEDDTLYSKEHFAFRPLDKIAYDMNRWVIFNWGEPFYFYKPHYANAGLIASRELFIKAWEERFAKFGDNLPMRMMKELGRNDYERHCGVTPVPVVEYQPLVPFLGICHTGSVEPDQQTRRKRAWPIRAYDIPKWGRAEEIIKKFI
jgi:hypothetical protein